MQLVLSDTTFCSLNYSFAMICNAEVRTLQGVGLCHGISGSVYTL